MSLLYDEKDKKYVYKKPSSEYLREKTKEINLLITNFINECYINYKLDVKIDFNVVFDIIVNVDKRNLYGSMFHDLSKPNEYRTIASYCYWIVRLHPIAITSISGNSLKIISDSNESFAVYLYLCTVKSLYSKSAIIDYEFIKELKYTLRYRELSKATIMLLLKPKIGIK